MLLTAEYYLVILIYSLFSLSSLLFFVLFFLQPLFPNHTSNLLFSALIQSRSNPVSLSRWWSQSVPLFCPSESLKTRIKDMQGKVDENHGGSTIT